MSMSVGASSNALSYLQSLMQGALGAGNSAASSDATAASNPLSPLLQALSGFGVATEQPTPAAASTNGTTGSGGSAFGPGTMAALLSLQDQSATGATAQTPSSLFSKLDTDGDGQVIKSEFETALTGAGASASTSTADALFAKLDANGDGSISQSELAKASHGRHHHMHGGGDSNASSASGQSVIDPLLSSTDAAGATTQTAANADGSTTTTISYADGSTVAMTTPAASTNSSGTAASGESGQNTNNLLEQLIQLQSQLLGSVTPTLSAVV
jgi:hypothetical protein